jgi:hypothetical protein
MKFLAFSYLFNQTSVFEVVLITEKNSASYLYVTIIARPERFVFDDVSIFAAIGLHKHDHKLLKTDSVNTKMPRFTGHFGLY